MNKLITLLISFVILNGTYSAVINRNVRDVASVKQLVQDHGYTCDDYIVQTDDGYKLTVLHIPASSTVTPKNKVVFLMHGILSSAADWVISGPNIALAYVLVQEGYDVWMGNARGNSLSRQHATLNPDTDPEFWQFSWEQIGRIDLPTMINFVLDTTGKENLMYVGHSQGTTSFFVMTSMVPEMNAKIEAQFSLAPIVYMNHMSSPILHFIAFFNGALELLTDMIGMNEFLPNNDLMGLVGDLLCGDDDLTQILCTNMLFAICGFSPSEMNATMLPLLMEFTPAGASTKQMLHYAQEIVSGHFRRYDYGMLGNLDHYGSMSPPDYDLKQVTADVYLFYSHNDWLAAEGDVLRLYDMLPNVKGRFLVTNSGFNHLDYMFGIHAKDYVYNKLISLMSRYN